MSSAIDRTFRLSEEQSAFIDTEVGSGNYESANDVVQAGLLALQDRDPEIERWLREEVVPTYDKMMADPSRSLSIDEVSASLRAHHEKRMRAAS